MNTVEVKTAELIGRALDWAVAKAVGIDVKANKTDDLWNLSAEVLVWDIPNYSTNWAQGGPLKSKYLVDSFYMAQGREVKCKCLGRNGRDLLSKPEVYGPTELIAACRAIVASEFGDTVMVPAELINGDEK